MTKFKLEVGRGYLNGYGHYVKIVDSIKVDDDLTAYYDDHTGLGYEENGQVVGSADPYDHRHITGEALVLRKRLFDELVYENPKRLRRVVKFTWGICAISAISSIASIYFFTNYCN